MSLRAPVSRPRKGLYAAAVCAALLVAPGTTDPSRAESMVAAAPEAGTEPARSPEVPRTAYLPLIARTRINGVGNGDVAVLRGHDGTFLVPLVEYVRWGTAPPHSSIRVVGGERYVALSAVDGLVSRFDPDTVTLDLVYAAAALPGTRIDLAPPRRSGVVHPADTSFFLNYALSAWGDADFGDLRYQATTELGARAGNWLLYGTSDTTWGDSSAKGFTRLLTNLQYDDRPNLRRLTLGDFFTPTFDLSGSVPMGGLNLAKLYSMDPNFVQYPTAAFATEVALPSTLEVRVDGNLVAQRNVTPGPLDVANLTGVTGARNVTLVVRDPFGREQVLQQPFYFATNAGLAQGLHEYSYSVGFLRRNYGIGSNDYGDLAAAAFHRYALTDRLTLGLRGQATKDLYNIGPFGTWQHPYLGVLGAGVSVGGRDGQSGPGGSLGWTYAGTDLSFALGARYLSRDYAQLSDFVSPIRPRLDTYASASAYSVALGSLYVTYSAIAAWEGPESRLWNISYTRSFLAGKALLTAGYIRTIEPQKEGRWGLSFRYYFDGVTSAVASVGAVRGEVAAAATLERTLPQGEGVGYSLTAGRGIDGVGATYGRGYVQGNGPRATVGAEYARTSSDERAPGVARVFVAGSVGAVEGTWFAARPVQDSFALIRLPGVAGVPVNANGWYVGDTDGNGAVVATNIASYYDNYISFGGGALPLDYRYDSSEIVISPPARSGTSVEFAVRRQHALTGVLVEHRDGTATPLEFREIELARDGRAIAGFTARRGEFYFDDVEPGRYRLRLHDSTPCDADVVVPDGAGSLTDVGRVVCERSGS